MDINLNIDFADLDLNAEIAKHYDEDGDLVGGVTLANTVVQKLVAQATLEPYHADLKHRVETIRDEEIRKAVAPSIAAALDTPFRRTNSYGEPQGAEITMREAIIQATHQVMNERADSYNRDKGSKLEVMIREHVQAGFKAEIADAVKAARNAVAEQLGDFVADAVAEAVKTGLSAR